MAIEGYSQPGSSANTLAVGDNAKITIELSGNGPSTTVQNAFTVNAGGTTIRGLAINQFRGDAFAIAGPADDQIAGDFLGTDPTGTIGEGNGTSSGMTIGVSASDVIIGGPMTADRTIVSASGYYGIVLAAGTGDQIQNCYIGTDASGTVQLGNYNQGIYDQGASNFTIGGTTAAFRNVISGNRSNAIALTATAGNVVEGNYIGTDSTGTVKLGNGTDGIVVSVGGNTIGGTQAGAGNVISGNAGAGLLINYSSAASLGNVVQGNLIGTDKTGTLPIPNIGQGINIGNEGDGGFNNLIGGTTAAARNVISGNQGGGIATGGSGTGNLIEGNYIGVDVSGIVALPNLAEGVNIGFNSVTVGGFETGSQNVIAGNTGDGILIFGDGSLVENNIVGLGADGSTPLGNGGNGVEVIGLVTIGGSFAGARNIISANKGNGIALGGGSTRRATVQDNYIGTDSTGMLDRGNKANGIYIGTADVTVATNVIAANGTKGDQYSTTGGITLGNIGNGAGSADNNTIQGNLIGTAADGVSPLGNVGGGIIFALGASNDEVDGNTIAYNNTSDSAVGGGVAFEYSVSAAVGDAIDGNSIFANSGLGIDLSDDGVTLNTPGGPHSGPNDLQNFPVITSVSSNSITTLIGGTLNAQPGTPFTIQFFSSPVPDPSGYGQGETFLGQLTGVTTDTTGNTSFTFSDRFPIDPGQYFTATATDASGNTSEFSKVFSLPVANPLIVTTTADSGPGSLRAAIEYVNSNPGTSTISFDIPGTGVQTIAPLTALPIVTNPVIIDGYTQPGAVPNTLPPGEVPDAILLIELSGSLAGTGASGLELAGGNSTVRGLVVSEFTTASAAGGNGIALTTKGGDLIEGDYLGTDSTGSLAEGNSQGVTIVSGTGDTIGGTAAGARNLISGNANYGAAVANFAADGTVIEGNLIGTDAQGIKALGNGSTGVELAGSSVILGGTIAGARNVISGNGGDGVYAATGDLIEGNYIGTDASGFVKLDNAGDGIDLGGPNNTVGGTGAPARNVISGNAGSGVMIVNASDNLIEGNHIGSGAPSTSPINLGNGRDGVTILSNSPEDQGPDKNTIGGTADGAGNEIAYNVGNGVTIASSGLAAATFAPTGDAILGNSIFTNAKLGIDLGNDGPTMNSPGGPHSGPNDLQNYPVITSAVSSDETMTLGGTFNSTPDTTFVLQFFGNLHEVSPGIFGSAVVMGTASVTTDTHGNTTFSENFLDFGGSYSATATDPGGNTSEFSQDFQTPAANPLIVTTTADSGLGSLRAAIIYANANPGDDTITFAIPGAGIQMIAPNSPLPTITVPVTIDGYTQPGAHSNTLAQGDSAAILIDIDGYATGDGGRGPSTGDGLVLAGGDSIIRGVAIGGFSSGAAVHLLTLGGDTIAGDLLGIDPTGTGPNPDQVGVQVETANNTIGGVALADRDVVSANTLAEVYLLGTGAIGNTVAGDYVGTNLAGTASLSKPGAGDGVAIDFGASGNTVGGIAAGARNVLSGNGASGVRIDGGTFSDLSTGNETIQGNFIGTDVSGTTDIGNGADGVAISDAFDNSIGGTNLAAGNTIAFNGMNGVDVLSGPGNPILGNLIIGNHRLGIDLGGDGVTPNTPGGPHTGPNDLQNFPVLSSVAVTASSTVIAGTLTAAPETVFTVQFFSNDVADPSGHGQGKTYLGELTNVVTNTDGVASFTAELATLIQPGEFVTATATDPGGNTSEFAQDIQLPAAAPANLKLSISQVTPNPVLTNQDYNYSVTITNDGPQDASNVVVSDALAAGSTLHTIVTAGSITNLSPTLTNVTFASLASGASVTIGMFVRDASAGIYNDTASVTANEADPDETNNSASVLDTVVAPSADLRLTMSSPTPNPVLTNQDYNYTVTITNVGPQDASNVVVSDALAAGSTLHTIVTAGSITNLSPTLTNVTFASLASGASVTIGMFVRDASAGIYNDTASVTANEADPDQTNNSASVLDTVVAPLPTTADLSVAGTATPGIAIVGKPLTYTFTVTNKGLSTATDVKLSDVLPAGVLFDSVQSSLGAETSVGGVVLVSISSLGAGKTDTVTIVVIPSTTETITDTATVSSDEADLHPADNQVTVVVATNLGAPTNVFSSLVKTSNGPYDVLVTWGYADGGESGIRFNVYRVDASGSEIKVSGSAGTSADDFVDTGAAANKTYKYRVTAFVGSGESARSDDTTMVVTLSSPAGPGAASSRARSRQASGARARSESNKAKAGKPSTIHGHRPNVQVKPTSQAHPRPSTFRKPTHRS